METNFKKKVLTLGLICLALLGMVLSLSFLGQRKVTRKGAFGTGTLSLTSIQAAYNVGDEFFVEARANTTEKTTSYDLAVSFDKTLLSIGASDFQVPAVFDCMKSSSVDAVNGKLLLRATFNGVCSGGQINPSDFPTGNVLLGKFKVKVLAAGTAQLAFADPTIVNGYNPQQSDIIITLTRTPLSLTLGAARTDIGTVNVSLEPSTATKPLNQTFEVDIKVDAGTHKIGYMQLGLSFDRNKIQVVGFRPNDVVFTPDLFEDSAQDLGSSTGMAKLFAASAKSTLPTGVFTAGRISLKGIVSGNAALTIDKIFSYFYGEKGTEEGTFGIDQTVNGAYTIGAGGTGAVNINFKIKFNGVGVSSPDQKVIVRILKGSLDQETPNVNVTSDANGIYSGTANFDVPAGSGYAIFIKGPKHLARKFCTNNQERFCARPGTLTLAAGANSFDFSKLNLEPGDLHDPNRGGKQDGVANSVDISLATARAASTDPADLEIADVDFDGQMSWHDVSLILNTIESRYEDDY